VKRNEGAKVAISVLGPFQMTGPGGEDLTPRAQKSCALLAILALTTNHKRPRASLQDKLWSDRGPVQGANSLRQALTEIRKCLGPYRDYLVSDNRLISLADNCFEVDIENLLAEDQPVGSRAEGATLLEGIGIRDEEFENWLRDERSAFQGTLSSHPGSVIEPAAVLGPDISSSFIQSSAMWRPWVRILSPTVATGDSGIFYSKVISDTIARGIQEYGAADISTVIRETPGIDLQVDVFPTDTFVAVHVTLLEARSGRLLWSGTQHVPSGVEFICNVAALQKLMNQSIDIGLIQLRNLLSDSDNENAYAIGFDALQMMFSGSRDNLSIAESYLDRAYERGSKGIMLALKAYSKTFLMGEHLADRKAHIEETQALLRQAIEFEPFNSNVLAFASYIHSFILADYRTGHDLAEKSLNYNPANPLALAFLGRAKTYLGKTDEGYRLLSRARTIAGPGPIRYTIEFLTGVAATLSGRYAEAIRLHEMSRTMEPRYRAPLRYLLILYLKTGDQQKARAILEEIRKFEPDFSLQTIRQNSYPSEGLRVSGLLDSINLNFE